MRKILFLLIILVCSAIGQETKVPVNQPKEYVQQKFLHISTIPSDADIYVNQLRPDHRKNPHAVSPSFIPITSEISQDDEIIVSLFRPEFTDTTIKVKLSAKDTSYLIVSLRPNYDENLKEEQEKILKKRYNRNFGKKMIFASAIPFAISAISGIVTWNQISQAEDAKKKIENSPLGSEESIQKNEEKFKQHRDNANAGKIITNTGISLGASLLAVGIVLQF